MPSENPERRILDSGERTVFETGFQRDMHAGKGRFDLLPWRAIWQLAKHCEEGALKYGERNIDKGAPLHSLLDSAVRHIAKYIMGVDDEPHLRAALWNIAWALEQEETHPELNDLPWAEGNIGNPFDEEAGAEVGLDGVHYEHGKPTLRINGEDFSDIFGRYFNSEDSGEDGETHG